MRIPNTTGSTVLEEITINASKGGYTNAQLVQSAAIRAEAAIGGVGRFAGTAKHTYAGNLLNRYQRLYGDRGLKVNEYFNGRFGKGFLDVHDVDHKIIYDFKFGRPIMRAAQFNKYYNTFGEPIYIVDRYGNLIPR
ncbi:hypothetical protein [Myroides odoratus]|uniref:Uncharacterized protein n=1 Tax=Myroides odoratus TaxID=256 RepID=A0A9Q7E9U5_MYROD|nr:hypothetical protein [Myroides odoratus]EHQ41711.1 hypothetical protein Myrod_0875 [Myroides odoratus DSM 2801]EKB08908.1 hypothetical protein HMPREF9716_00569 [Myroides odoratus CIP 103059]QQT99118.1 hypothetical protein I6I88_12960 [Myroides odoratus]WQD58689.1 hypothetical protein U0010_06005 [Myroides odoratus]STZ28970.1 Uncharacterised protein [Myroides odoratus]